MATKAPKGAYFAHVKDGASFVKVGRKDGGNKFTIPGTLAQLEAGPDIAEQLKPLLWNDIKMCPNCGKPNAYTMAQCNACTHDLSAVPMTKGENVFMAFLLGIEKGERFPLAISLRCETETALVFDDLLSLAPCHLNVIPKKVYVPDWRFLLNDPAEAIKLLDEMTGSVRDVMKTQFWDNEDWRAQYYGDSCESFDDFMAGVGFGFNFPPSQFQLHIQCVAVPLFPLHHYLLEKDQHFHQRRFFPLCYARECLKVVPEGYKVDRNTSAAQIIDDFDKLGVSYDAVRHEFVKDLVEKSAQRAKFKSSDFEYLVVNNERAHAIEVEPESGNATPGAEVTGVTLADVNKRDKMKLETYGGGTDGQKPCLEYIGSPRKPVIGADGFTLWKGVA